MKLAYRSLSILIFLYFLIPSAHAANPGDVVINEIAWMGSPPQDGETTSQAANDEWIELYNTTGNTVDTNGWILKSRDGNPIIELIGSIPQGNYFVLSRANESVGSIAADLTYPYDTKRSALGNGGEYLELLDNQGNIIDNVGLWNMDWFAGDNTTKQTMERKNPNVTGSDPVTWGTSTAIGGTPKAQNSVYQGGPASPLTPQGEQTPPMPPPPTEPAPTAHVVAQEDPPPSPAPTAATSTPSESAPQAPIYPSNIFINELMPFPLGTDELEEWVELINENAQPADISLWQIKDMIGAINIYTFPQGTTLPANGFTVLSRPTTKMTMNNDNDGVQLIRPDGELIQTVPYEKAPKGKSYVRNSGIWKWSAIPTPGSVNIVPASPAPPKQTDTIEDIKKVTKKYDATLIEPERPDSLPITSKQTASIGEASSGKISSKLTAFIASFVALFSAIFIFLLKKRLRKDST